MGLIIYLSCQTVVRVSRDNARKHLAEFLVDGKCWILTRVRRVFLFRFPCMDF